ncbi:hypothetical protein N0V84_004240 [Fusarium piperis]|uniref:Zn(2)-C6 fungal-type domain-containing protein n=1 Tax=Fusarium piperis TaxID=1435070 RepID=A0A9W8WFZ3_9HYPO|nr:hypothetical protein N0V84_004240 [Fusarium piperis]
MNATKWRISKACQECRVKKIKCNGETPCQNCRLRNLGCIYREKARNRTRKVKPRTAAYESIMSHDAMAASPSLEPSDEGTTVPPTPVPVTEDATSAPAASAFGSDRSINNNSVAAAHRASPSCYLQLYYGPSSNFALLNAIYHQIAGTCTAVRKAIAAGLHKDAHMCPGQSNEDADQRRVMFWSLFFWETWQCFVVGRPSSIPDPGPAIPVPKNQKHLISLVTLSRIMSKCVKRIYSPKHDSLLPVWNAAIEIRRELHRFAEKQLKDMKFGLVSDPTTGELGVCQAMVSTMYHHTLLLTFRPFLILRAKLKQEKTSSPSSAEALHAPPPWLDNACEYCLEAARNSIGFLTSSCATNTLCHDIKYHGFFIEGACYALAFDMLQEKKTAHRNLPWIHSGLRCLRSMIAKAGANAGQLPTTISSIEQMVRSAGFELKDQVDPDMRQSQSQQPHHSTLPGSPAMPPASVAGEEPAFTFPSMPFGFDVTGQVNGTSPMGVGSDEQADFTAADVGWDIDFGTMNMEAFLSLDPTEAFNFAL